MDKSRNHEGYLLAELCIVILLLGLLGGWIFQSWSEHNEEKLLQLAVQEVVGAAHEAQELARANTGPNAPYAYLICLGQDNTFYVKYEGKVWHSPKKLPEGIIFSSKQRIVVTFMEDGRPLNFGEYDYKEIVLQNNRGNMKRLIISVQTGRIRVE